MKTKLAVLSLLFSSSLAISLTDASDQILKKHASDAMAHVNAISDGKRVQEELDAPADNDARDLNPESPLFYAQEHDEIVKGWKHQAGEEEGRNKK